MIEWRSGFQLGQASEMFYAGSFQEGASEPDMIPTPCRGSTLSTRNGALLDGAGIPGYRMPADKR